jgi:hypothetical protein
VHRIGYYSLSWAPDMVLFIVMCAPDMLLFIVMCTRQVTIHCPMHRTGYHSLFCVPASYYPLSCAPSNNTLSLFPSFFIHLTSTFGRIFLGLKQTHLEYNPIDLVLETYLFPVLLLAFLFLLKQSSKWHFLYRKS